jgi:hypothetical protein
MKRNCLKSFIVISSILISFNALACNTSCCGGDCANNGSNQNFESMTNNTQTQTQGSWSCGFGGCGGQNGSAGVYQHQTGNGGTESGYGSSAFENQAQGEEIHFSNGITSFDSMSNTWGGSGMSETVTGSTSHFEEQIIDNDAFVNSDGNGTSSAAGSSMNVDQYTDANVNMCTHGCSESTAGAESGTYTHNISQYNNENIGDNAGIIQSGQQTNEFINHSIVTNHGYANGTLTASQQGETNASNNNQGTHMTGNGYANGSININTNTGCNGETNVGGYQSQVHHYEQYAGNEAQSQWANGTVGTTQNTDTTCTNVGCR